MGKKQKMDIEMVEYDDEPDWETLSILPMAKCSTKKYCTSIWEYFGQLMRGTVCVDNRNFYCLTCFEERRLKQYSASTATTNFYVHLRSIHGIILERNTINKNKNHKTQKKIIKNDLENIEVDEIQDDSGDHDETLPDVLDEMLVVKKKKIDDSNFIPKTRMKSKKIISKHERLKPIPQTSSANRVPLKIEDSINSEDYDRLFILSLIKEFRRVPDFYRMDCKSEMLDVLKKFQRMHNNSLYNLQSSKASQSFTITAEIDTTKDGSNSESHTEFVDAEFAV